ncbi:hypothetical protein NGRA_2684 [Nosema granulosis]|uniref:CCHC-type domain-containing protein n=1 Tax=Nosema granulosis TaxID=83296 RepID=A0A9P6GZD8_9MICR|nr:hypothetical protein NGRA_2684 [Nosema granulosis]
MTYMANTRSEGETRGFRGQAARNMLQEYCESVSLKQASMWTNTELQNFMIEKKIIRANYWEEVIVELENFVSQEEETERREMEKIKEREEMVNAMRSTIREELKEEENRRRWDGNSNNNNYAQRRVPRQCFVCGKAGHIAGFCEFKKGGSSRARYENDNKNLEYLGVKVMCLSSSR